MEDKNSMTRYGNYLRVDLQRYWNAYPEAVGPVVRVLMMLFQWELHAVILYRLNFHITWIQTPVLRPVLGYIGYVLQKLNEAVSGVRLPASVSIGPGFFYLAYGQYRFPSPMSNWGKLYNSVWCFGVR